MPSISRAASAAAGAVDNASKLQQLTNLNEINRLLHETIAKERAIEAELDKQLSKRSELERNILLLNATTSEVRHSWLGLEVCAVLHLRL